MRRTIILFLVLLAGCNLETSESVTPTFEPLPTTSYVAPTPYRAPTLLTAPTLVGGQGALGAQNVGATPVIGATPTGRNILTPVPAEILLENPQPSPGSQNAIEAFVNNLVIPAWNFVYTFVLEGVGTLWLFAGARGGVFAQVFCCVGPGVVVVVAVLLRLRIIRWRR
jgi:hypothetical protein